MPESLFSLQVAFTLLQARFVLEVSQKFPNYELTDGDSFRDPRVHGILGEKMGYGHKNSAHKKRLARDYNLFINGVYQLSTEAHRPLGELWESLHPRARWGGRFQDGNHYSFEHDGIM